MTDDFIHIGMRMQLVDELRAKGIKDENVLGAIAEIPGICLWIKYFEILTPRQSISDWLRANYFATLHSCISNRALTIKAARKSFRSWYRIRLSNSGFSSVKNTSFYHRKTKRLVC